MEMAWDNLVIGQLSIEVNDLLSEWRWLVGESYKLLLVSALGDLFLQAKDGSIFWLDTGGGQLIPVAASADEFRSLLQQADFINEWFNPRLVNDLIIQAGRLKPGQCYSYKIALTLGGKMEPSNFEPTDLSVHFGILGQLQRQLRDLPDGTSISKIKFKGTGPNNRV